jgi:hypothetical protein
MHRPLPSPIQPHGHGFIAEVRLLDEVAKPNAVQVTRNQATPHHPRFFSKMMAARRSTIGMHPTTTPNPRA